MNRTLYGFSVVSAYCVRYYYICTEGYTYKQVEYQPDYRAVRSDGGNPGRFGCAREVSDYGYIRGVEAAQVLLLQPRAAQIAEACSI